MTPGTLIGLVDRKGTPVRIGDTLAFDPREWGGECQFVVGWNEGELDINGTPSDIPEWCTIVKPWVSPVEPAAQLQLRVLYLCDAAKAFRERGDAIRAGTTAPWSAQGSSPIDNARRYFNAASSATKLAEELAELAELEEKWDGK